MDAPATSPSAPQADPAPKIGATQARLLRLLERFGQTELTRRTGIPQPRLSRWKAGEVPVAADDALVLLELEERLSGADDESAAAAGLDQKAG